MGRRSGFFNLHYRFAVYMTWNKRALCVSWNSVTRTHIPISNHMCFSAVFSHLMIFRQSWHFAGMTFSLDNSPIQVRLQQQPIALLHSPAANQQQWESGWPSPGRSPAWATHGEREWDGGSAAGVCDQSGQREFWLFGGTRPCPVYPLISHIDACDSLCVCPGPSGSQSENSSCTCAQITA